MKPTTSLVSALSVLTSIIGLTLSRPAPVPGPAPAPQPEIQGRAFNSRFAPKARPVFPRTVFDNYTTKRDAMPEAAPEPQPQPIALPEAAPQPEPVAAADPNWPSFIPNPFPTGLPHFPKLPRDADAAEAPEAPVVEKREPAPEAAPVPAPEPAAAPLPNPVAAADPNWPSFIPLPTGFPHFPHFPRDANAAEAPEAPVVEKREPAPEALPQPAPEAVPEPAPVPAPVPAPEPVAAPLPNPVAAADPNWPSFIPLPTGFPHFPHFPRDVQGSPVEKREAQPDVVARNLPPFPTASLGISIPLRERGLDI